MRIDEVESANSLDPNKLMGLVNFLSGRADNENAQKQISTQAFISTAQSLGFPVNQRNIVSVVSQPPLDSVLQPIDPNNPNVIMYKGSDTGASQMPVDKAQDIVAASAKAAMNRGKSK